MNAKPKNVMKYASIYLNQKCDVLLIPLSTKKIILPVPGIQAVAKDVGAFLSGPGQYERLLVHGFSGGFMTWGLLLDEMMQDKTRYAPIADKFVGQVWDSIIIMDSKTLLQSLSSATVPKNVILRKLFKIYLEFHMAVLPNINSLYNQGFKQVRENSLITCPALVFGSRSDPLWNYDCVLDTIDSWKKKNIEVDLKLWDVSPHGRNRETKFPIVIGCLFVIILLSGLTF
ncbi:unnamed protein product [Allacma fusca]|uniref:Uncharacterized protein n=1 Tax=Allacma fusca TaxID=39272 RepID=A0A8J2NKJ6_9HEXA|nr:unnamed protein product [Allacma fusca]